MIDPKKSACGIAYPDGLALLKKVYDLVCWEQGLAKDCPEAAELAARAMDLFRQGVFEGTSALRQPQM